MKAAQVVPPEATAADTRTTPPPAAKSGPLAKRYVPLRDTETGILCLIEADMTPPEPSAMSRSGTHDQPLHKESEPR